MSERDCGKWYCQKSPGFARLKLGQDVIIWEGERAADHDRKDLAREREQLTGWVHPPKGWFGRARQQYPDMWLAAYSHGDGSAKNYWVWDPDSRGKYFEANGPWNNGEISPTFGKLHKGLGWQLPLLAVFNVEPNSEDLKPLKKYGIPYVVLSDQTPPPPDDEECDPCDSCCDCDECEECEECEVCVPCEECEVCVPCDSCCPPCDCGDPCAALSGWRKSVCEWSLQS